MQRMDSENRPFLSHEPEQCSTGSPSSYQATSVESSLFAVSSCLGEGGDASLPLVDEDNAEHAANTSRDFLHNAIMDALTETIAEATETIKNVVTNVSEVVTHVAGDLQHTLEAMAAPHPSNQEEEHNNEGFAMSLSRNPSLLPGDWAQAAAAVEDHQPPSLLNVLKVHHQDTASFSASDYDTIETISASLGLKDKENLKSPGQLDSLGTVAGHTLFEQLSDKLHNEKDDMMKNAVVIEDPKHLVEDFLEQQQEQKQNKTTSDGGTTPLSAYLLLVGAVLGLSSIGPFYKLQGDVDPTIRIVWRHSATTLCLLPLALHSIRHERGLPRLTFSQCVILWLTGLSYAGCTFFFGCSLEYTSVGNAVILANCQSLLFLVGRVIMFEQISTSEAFGALVGFTGAVLCSRDASSSNNDGQQEISVSLSASSLKGNFLALMSAVTGLVYLVTAKTVRPEMNFYTFMFCVFFLATLHALLFSFMAGVQITLDRNAEHGIVGWMNLDSHRLPLEMGMVLACQFLGAMGYIRCMHYFSNLVISVATLLEPVVAEMTAVALGVAQVPGWMGWLGNALVILGTLAVVYQPMPHVGVKVLNH